MGNTYAIMALRRKRAYIAGEIASAERALAKQRETLATLDATIRLFEPAINPELIASIRPTRRGTIFRHGEQMRLAMAALREAERPLPARGVAEYAMLAKGLPTDDSRIVSAVTQQIRVALHRLEAKGIARRVICAPDTWWELVYR